MIEVVYELHFTIAKQCRIKVYFSHPENFSRKYFRNAIMDIITKLEAAHPNEGGEQKFTWLVAALEKLGFKSVEKLDYHIKTTNNKLRIDPLWAVKPGKKKERY